VFRKDLIPLLRDNPMSVAEIARQVELPIRRVRDDLEHLARSLKHTDVRLVVTPARCRKCGFEFSPDKLARPGKCPRCKGTWISDPLVETRGGP
jgi:hypothetical protein